jgi:hypothetical protein
MSTEVSSTTTLTALHVTEKLGIPAFPALLQPYLDPTGCFPAVMMPYLPVGGRIGTRYNCLTYRVFEGLIWAFVGRQINRWCEERLGLAPSPANSFELIRQRRTPTLICRPIEKGDDDCGNRGIRRNGETGAWRLLPDEEYGVVLLYNQSYALADYEGIKQGLLDLLEGKRSDTGGLDAGTIGIILAALTLLTITLQVRGLLQLPGWAAKQRHPHVAAGAGYRVEIRAGGAPRWAATAGGVLRRQGVQLPAALLGHARRGGLAGTGRCRGCSPWHAAPPLGRDRVRIAGDGY